MKTKPLTALHQDSRNPLFPLLLAAFVTVLSVTCFASYSFGVDMAKKLLALGHCPECDLSGADLFKANLRGAKLNGADLSKADLYGADLTEADLARANLQQANLRGANLTGANLETAKLFQVKISGETIFCNTKTPWGLDNSGCK
jgi:uncharacterized protein YjbI with pentapeptide repeats